MLHPLPRTATVGPGMPGSSPSPMQTGERDQGRNQRPRTNRGRHPRFRGGRQSGERGREGQEGREGKVTCAELMRTIVDNVVQLANRATDLNPRSVAINKGRSTGKVFGIPQWPAYGGRGSGSGFGYRGRGRGRIGGNPSSTGRTPWTGRNHSKRRSQKDRARIARRKAARIEAEEKRRNSIGLGAMDLGEPLSQSQSQSQSHPQSQSQALHPPEIISSSFAGQPQDVRVFVRDEESAENEEKAERRQERFRRSPSRPVFSYTSDVTMPTDEDAQAIDEETQIRGDADADAEADAGGDEVTWQGNEREGEREGKRRHTEKAQAKDETEQRKTEAPPTEEVSTKPNHKAKTKKGAQSRGMAKEKEKEKEKEKLSEEGTVAEDIGRMKLGEEKPEEKEKELSEEKQGKERKAKTQQNKDKDQLKETRQVTASSPTLLPSNLSKKPKPKETKGNKSKSTATKPKSIGSRASKSWAEISEAAVSTEDL